MRVTKQESGLQTQLRNKQQGLLQPPHAAVSKEVHSGNTAMTSDCIFGIIYNCRHVCFIVEVCVSWHFKHISSSVHSNQSTAAQICPSNPNRLTVFTNLLCRTDTQTLCKGINYYIRERLSHFSAAFSAWLMCLRFLSWTTGTIQNPTTKEIFRCHTSKNETGQLEWAFKTPSGVATCSFPRGSLPGWAAQTRAPGLRIILMFVPIICSLWHLSFLETSGLVPGWYCIYTHKASSHNLSESPPKAKPKRLYYLLVVGFNIAAINSSHSMILSRTSKNTVLKTKQPCTH